MPKTKVKKKDSVIRIERIKKYLEGDVDKKIEEVILAYIKDIEKAIDGSTPPIPEKIEDRKKMLEHIDSESKLCEWLDKQFKTAEKVQAFLTGIIKPKLIKYKQIKTIAKHAWPDIKIEIAKPFPEGDY
ncbi:hypothetical protein MBAV_004152 [Candidatus Magnetobacterium bavaricum]|uniref:Uncharacterized protein n=1 Tax=Candidatus Magnetobacterium bavaricum TaxID=29290 RepID=A0A0F3GP99_9BACT|nr:hypothetical protein MBAV_004152 [Candidatus Magnetobacterium bavaricum]